MKIQILQHMESFVSGYLPILIDNEDFEIDKPNNSITSILIIDDLEYISYDKLHNFLIKLRTILRLNGTITVRGIDLMCLSKELICNNFDIENYNNIVFRDGKKAIYSSHVIAELIKTLGLQINYLKLKGITYELQASRSN